MAPDTASAAAGKKLMAANQWPELGRLPAALWGKCQGSSVYQVKVDLVNLGYNCSCPSRKLPCKHVLGLLMLAAQSPEAVPLLEAPAWVDDWLLKRRACDEKQSVPETRQARGPVEQQAARRRALQRSKMVHDGLQRLDLWLHDMVRAGVADVAGKPASYWEEQAKRLVDAQAPGLAERVARLAALPRSSPDWAQRLLVSLS
jgi:hypothetical protein